MREEEALVVHDFETMKVCVRAYLKYIAKVETTLADIAEDIERIEARLELLGVSFDSPGAGDSSRDKLPDGLAKAAELHDAWEREMAHHAEELAEAKRLCRPVHESRRVLWLHYVERRTWDATARMVGYSNKQTRRMADAGVREIYDLMPERWRRDPIPNAMPR